MKFGVRECANITFKATSKRYVAGRLFEAIALSGADTITIIAANDVVITKEILAIIDSINVELVITNGRCHVNYIGARKYPINKVTATNPALTATNNEVTWTISNSDLATKDVFIRVYETVTGNTVEVDSTVTLSTITLKLYTDSASVSAGSR